MSINALHSRVILPCLRPRKQQRSKDIRSSPIASETTKSRKAIWVLYPLGKTLAELTCSQHPGTPTKKSGPSPMFVARIEDRSVTGVTCRGEQTRGSQVDYEYCILLCYVPLVAVKTLDKFDSGLEATPYDPQQPCGVVMITAVANNTRVRTHAMCTFLELLGNMNTRG